MQVRIARKSFLVTALVFYLVFAAGGLLWTHLAGIEGVLGIRLDREHFGLELLIIAATLLLNVLFDVYLPRVLPPVRRLFHTLAEALGGIGYGEAVLLAAVSALGEELLFRGAVQPSLGIAAASVLFALSHFPVRKELIVWPFYALAMGLILGSLRILGGDIWTAVLLHFSVNAFGLVYLVSRRKAGRREHRDLSRPGIDQQKISRREE